jgi:hypothetical protein
MFLAGCPRRIGEFSATPYSAYRTLFLLTTVDDVDLGLDRLLFFRVVNDGSRIDLIVRHDTLAIAPLAPKVIATTFWTLV